METMLILGSYVFGLNTAAFQELNRNTEWRWAAQEIFGGKPAMQFTGWGEDTITLAGVILPEYWGGTGQLDALRALGDTGLPQTVVDGRGNVLGEFVVVSVQEKQATFGPAGVARRQEFTMALKRWEATEPVTGSSGGVSVTGSLSSVASGVQAAVPAAGKVAGLSGVVSSAVSAAGSSVTALSGIQSSLQGALGTVRQVSGAVGSALTAARTLQSAAQDAVGAVKSLTSASSYTTALSSVTGLLSTASSTAAAATRASAMIQQAGGATSALVEVNRLAATATSIRSQALAAVGWFK